MFPFSMLFVNVILICVAGSTAGVMRTHHRVIFTCDVIVRFIIYCRRPRDGSTRHFTRYCTYLSLLKLASNDCEIYCAYVKCPLDLQNIRLSWTSHVFFRLNTNNN